MELGLGRLRPLARRAIPALFEGTIAPIGLFYVCYAVWGLWAGLVAGLAWSYGAALARRLRGHRVSGLVLLSILALTVRTAVAFVTGSAFLYFLQPTIGTIAVGGLFLASAVVGRPLTRRLALDLIPLPDSICEHPSFARLHINLSYLWAGALMLNGAMALWLLSVGSIGAFLLLKTVAHTAVIAGAVLLSTIWFVRWVRHQRLDEALA